jgi:ribonuclease P protein component
VLPPANRLRRSTDFATVIRSGDRARRGHFVVHLHPSLSSGAPRVGLVVSKAVGGSVVRHQVSRRLRAQLGIRLGRLPHGSATVVRALSGAGADSSSQIGLDLDGALDRLVGGR